MAKHYFDAWFCRLPVSGLSFKHSHFSVISITETGVLKHYAITPLITATPFPGYFLLAASLWNCLPLSLAFRLLSQERTRQEHAFSYCFPALFFLFTACSLAQSSPSGGHAFTTLRCRLIDACKCCGKGLLHFGRIYTRHSLPLNNAFFPATPTVFSQPCTFPFSASASA